MNFFGKMLVMLQVVMSVAAMTWGMLLVLQGRDFGWIEPERVVVTRKPDGSEDKVIRFASEYDKSLAALREVIRARNTTMVYVQPALDSLRATDPYLSGNALFYAKELKRLRTADEKIEIKRLQNLGLTIEPNTGRLGKPLLDKKVDMIDQSFKSYTEDLTRVHKEIDAVELEIRKIVMETRKMTDELTGTVSGPDPLKDPPVYAYPGLYQMIDLEFQAQNQFKIEIETIKPHWSKAVEHARRFQFRRLDLEATLEKLTPVLGIQTIPKESGGLLVVAVTPNSPAEKAGLKADDILLKFDDQAITMETPLRTLVLRRKVGDQASLDIVRGMKSLRLRLEIDKR